MPIAGTVIVINSNNPQNSAKIARAIREEEKDKAYYHVGTAVLQEHFIPYKCKNPNLYSSALYAGISGTARCGADVVADLQITQQKEFEILSRFLHQLDVVWINIDLETEFVKSDLTYTASTATQNIAKEILQYMSQRFKYALSYVRFASEFSPTPKVKNPGKIILLIGTPSSGKSTLCKTIQDTADATYLNVGIDAAVLYYLHLRYLSGVPEHDNDKDWYQPNYNPTKYHKEGISWIAPGPNAENPSPYIRMQVGVEGRRAISAMYATIAEMSRAGFNVVSDHCFHYENSFIEAQHRFQDLPVTYVSLCPELKIIQQREQQRGDRMNGMAESIYYQMFNDYAADIKIDTGLHKPEDAAKQVLDFIK